MILLCGFSGAAVADGTSACRRLRIVPAIAEIGCAAARCVCAHVSLHVWLCKCNVCAQPSLHPRTNEYG